MGLFLGAKDAAEDFAGGIIDGRMEDQARAAVLEPGMMTAVHLDEETGLRHALAPAAMAGWATGPGAADASGAEEPTDGGAGQVDGFPLLEQVSELVIVDAGIGRAGQREDPLAEALGNALRGWAAPVPMGQRRDPLGAHFSQEPTDVPDRHGQELRGSLSGKGPGLDAGQDMRSLLLLLGQGDRLPVHCPRVTESLIC